MTRLPLQLPDVLITESMTPWLALVAAGARMSGVAIEDEWDEGVEGETEEWERN